MHDKNVNTVTSMKPNLVEVKKNHSSNGKNISIVDFPGHPRLRSKLKADYMKRAKKIVFVIDSSNNAASIRDAAELLYDVFIDPALEHNGPPIFVACSKSDLPNALPALRMKLKLQEEIEKVRKTRQSVEESNESTNRVVLGREGQPFNVDRDSPVEIIFEAISAQGSKLDALMNYLEMI